MSSMPPPPPPPPMSPPPGYVAYGSADAHSAAYQGVRRISKAMVVLIWIYLPLQLLGILELARLSHQANKFLDGSISEQSFKDSTRAGVGLGAALMVVPIAVLTMIWMYRMSANLRKMGRPGQTWAPGWGIGSWFVPPCAVYAVPWLMFKELWKGSDPALPPGAPNWKQGRVPPLITVWWVLYGLVPIFSIGTNSQFIAAVNKNDTTRELAQRYHDYAGRSFVFAIVGIGATIVYLMLVRQLSSRHMQATREP